MVLVRYALPAGLLAIVDDARDHARRLLRRLGPDRALDESKQRAVAGRRG